MNKNVQALRNLYEAGFDHLHELIQGMMLNKGDLGKPIEQIKSQTHWIHEVAKTLILINQIESHRKEVTKSGVEENVKTIRKGKEIINIPPPTGLSDFNPPPLPQIN